MSKLVTPPSTFNHPEGYAVRLPLPDPRGFRRLRRQQVRALKREISAALSAGFAVRDPLTSKPIQIYRHSIFAAQVRALDRLREISDEMRASYVHIKRFANRKEAPSPTARRRLRQPQGGAFAKLVLWDLVKPLKPASRFEQEACDGKWMITKRGRQFLAGALRVPRQVAVLLGVRIGYVDADDRIGITDVTDAFDRKQHLSSTSGRKAVA